MERLVIAMGVGLVAVGTCGNSCGNKPPEVPPTEVEKDGTNGTAEPPQPQQGYIERTNENLGNMKQGLQNDFNARENQLDQKIGQ